MLFAPLLQWVPFSGPAPDPEMLDEQIRAGRDAREEIIRESLSSLDAAGVAAAWTLVVANRLHTQYPAIADEFLLAAGNHEAFSGQALLVQTINAKLAVLTEARKRVPT